MGSWTPDEHELGMTSAVVVGSGPNGLAAALVLAAAGVEVVVLEAADTVGGGTRSSELTVPGLVHDECSGFHPLAVDTAFSRQFDLTAHGLRWLWPAVQYAHPLDGGRGAAAYRSVAQTALGLGRDGPAWRQLLAPLTRRFASVAEDILQPVLHVPAHPLALAGFGAVAVLPAAVLGRRFPGEEGRALFAGAAAHAFRPFSSVASSAIGLALAGAAHRYGWPVAEGGSGAISRAMVAMLEGLGGRVETGVCVTSFDELDPSDVVMLDVAPSAAARIAGSRMPPHIARALRRYRHGPGAFKVDFAVAEGVPWTHAPTRRAGTVHVGGTLAEIAHAESLVHRGRMPERPYVLVGQQYVADPSRSRGGVHPLYAYAHVPAGWPGDATRVIEEQIERFAPGFRERVLARTSRSTADLERHDPNYVGGDIICGANDPLQLALRPRPTLDPYALGVDGVYLCSAATPPGAGAHGMCGYRAATVALSRLR